MQAAGTTSMAKDGDEKDLDEHTRVGVAPTPKLPGAPPAPGAAPSGPAPDEHTQLGAKPPPQIGPRPGAAPPPPAGAPDAGEATRIGTAPPPIPKPPAVPPAASPAPPPQAKPPTPVAPPAAPAAPAAAPPAGAGADFAEHTILLADLQKPVVSSARLQRMQPPGRSEIVALDRTHYLVGRLPSCDLRLYSQTASREHAQLTNRDGRWYLAPVSGKAVLVNGAQVKEEVPLTHKMRLQLGGDELLFLDESGAAAVTAVRSQPGAQLAGNRWWLYAIGVLVLIAALWLWAGR